MNQEERKARRRAVGEAALKFVIRDEILAQFKTQGVTPTDEVVAKLIDHIKEALSELELDNTAIPALVCAEVTEFLDD